jgi:hypothetical protein
VLSEGHTAGIWPSSGRSVEQVTMPVINQLFANVQHYEVPRMHLKVSLFWGVESSMDSSQRPGQTDNVEIGQGSVKYRWASQCGKIGEIVDGHH